MNVLWAYRTTKRRSIGESPFTMVYRTEAIIPTEMRLPTLRTKMVEEDRNEQQLGRNLDLIEETRDEAAIKL